MFGLRVPTVKLRRKFFGHFRIQRCLDCNGDLLISRESDCDESKADVFLRSTLSSFCFSLTAACRDIIKLPTEHADNRPRLTPQRHVLTAEDVFLRLSQLLFTVRNCRLKLSGMLRDGRFATRQDKDDVTKAFDWSTTMLKQATKTAYSQGHFKIVRKLLQTGLKTHHFKEFLDTWMKCHHKTKKGGIPTLSEQEGRICLTTLTIKLAREGNHGLLFRLLASRCGYAQDADNSSTVECNDCLLLWKKLAKRHRKDIEGNLAAAFWQSLDEKNYTTAGHILWLMATTSDGKIQLNWQDLGLFPDVDRALLDALAAHKSIDVHSISLAGNKKLTKLPTVVLYMRSLCKLDISATKIGLCFPSELFCLPHLETIVAAHCRLKTWPEVHSVHQSLLQLNVRDNELTDVPTAFRTSRLKKLDIANNHLESITSTICSIKTLEDLDVSGNRIRDLSTGLLRLTHLRSLKLEGLGLRAPFHACRLDLAAIKRKLRVKHDQMREEMVKKVIVIGENTSEHSRSEFVRALVGCKDTSGVSFVDFGSVTDYEMLCRFFENGEAHYVIHLDARQDAQAVQHERITPVLSKYLNAVNQTVNAGRESQVIIAVEMPPDVDSLPQQVIDDVRSSMFAIRSSSERAREQDVKKLARAIRNTPPSSLQTAKSLQQARFMLHEKRQEGQLPLLMDVDDFNHHVILPSVDVRDQMDHNPDWLTDLNDYLLRCGDGAVLQNIHPSSPIVVCTSLSLLLLAVRKMMLGSSDSTTITHAISSTTEVTTLLAGITAPDSEVPGIVQSLWTFCEQRTLAVRLADSGAAFLPARREDMPFGHVEEFILQPNIVHRFCGLFSSLPAEAWRQFQARFLQFREAVEKEARATDSHSSVAEVTAIAWIKGVAFLSGNTLLAMALLDPNYELHQSKSTVLFALRKEIAPRLLGTVIDDLMHICEDFRSMSPPTDPRLRLLVPCTRCMSRPDEKAKICVDAHALLDKLTDSGQVKLNCFVHGDEDVLDEYLADLLLQDFQSEFDFCQRSQLTKTSRQNAAKAEVIAEPLVDQASSVSAVEQAATRLQAVSLSDQGEENSFLSERDRAFSSASQLSEQLQEPGSSSDDEFHTPYDSLSLVSSLAEESTGASSAATSLHVATRLSMSSPDGIWTPHWGSDVEDEAPSDEDTVSEDSFEMVNGEGDFTCVGMMTAANVRALTESAASPPKSSLIESKEDKPVLKGCFASVFLEEVYLGTPVARKVFNVEDLAPKPYSTLVELRKELTVYSQVKHNTGFLGCVHPMVASRQSVELIMERQGPALARFLSPKPSKDRILHNFSRLQWHRMLLSLAQAVDYLHREGVVHRDIKLDNILVPLAYESLSAADTRCYLIDFNVSVTVRSGSLHSSAGALEYAAPEVAKRDQHYYGLPSDLFRLGIVFLEVCTGHPVGGVNEDQRQQLRVCAEVNTLGLKAVLMASEKCVKGAPSHRPPASNLIRFLRLPDSHFLVESRELPSGSNSFETSSLDIPHVFAGVGKSSLCAIRGVRGAGEHCTWSVHCVPLLPTEHMSECLVEKQSLADKKERIWTFCVAGNGLVFLGLNRFIEIYRRLDAGRREQAAKPIRVAHHPSCMVCHNEFLFAGLEDGEIIVLKCITKKNALTVCKLETVTSIPSIPVKQIVPIEAGGVLTLCCLSPKTRHCVDLVVRCMVPSEDGYDILRKSAEQLGKTTRSGHHSGQLRQIAKASSSKDILWGIAGQELVSWSTQNFKITHRLDITTFGPVNDLCKAEQQSVATSRPLSDILSMCCVNGVLWIGLRRGAIVLLSESNLQLLTILHGHCHEVRRLIIVPPRSQYHRSGMECCGVNPCVVSVGTHARLLCPKQTASLKSSAELWSSDGVPRPCQERSYFALMWEACRAEEISSVLGVST